MINCQLPPAKADGFLALIFMKCKNCKNELVYMVGDCNIELYLCRDCTTCAIYVLNSKKDIIWFKEDSNDEDNID